MTGLDHRSEIGDRDARVERGRGEAPMAEQRLDVAEIGAAAQQMRRAGVPQRVRREVQAETTAIVLEAHAETHGGEPTSMAREEERSVDATRELRSTVGEVDIKRGGRGAADRDDAVFAAFAGAHEQQAVAEIEKGN